MTHVNMPPPKPTSEYLAEKAAKAAANSGQPGMVEIGIQRGGGQFISQEDYERIAKEAPLIADRLRREGSEVAKEYAREALEFQGAKEAAKVSSDVEKAVKYSSRFTPPPAVTGVKEETTVKKNVTQEKAIETLRKGGYATTKGEFPQGGAPFESYEETRAFNVTKFLQDNKSNLNPAIKTLEKAGFTKKQIQDARFDAFASKSELLPGRGEAKPMTWSEKTAANLQDWQKDFLSKEYGGKAGDIKFDSKVKTGLATAAEGTIGAGVAALLGLPILALNVISKPKESPQQVWEAGKYIVMTPINTGVNIAKGTYIPDMKQGNLYPLAFDTTMTALIVKGFAGPVKGALSKVTTYVAPRGVPASAIAKEVSTGRIKTPEQFAKQYADALNEVEKLATEPGGKFTGEVPIEGTPYSLRYLKSPLEQKIGNVLFHGTKTEVGKPSLLDIAAGKGEITAGKAGIYTDPWAAIGYTRGGENPGLLMMITEASKIKSGAKGLEKGLTQSDKFIRGADEGFYGSSKVWHGDLETEIVGAPGTKINVPEPTADLATRALAGKYSDFFTYDSGKFMPIKIGVDAKAFNAKSLAAINNPANWYSVKLYSLYSALRDTAEAMKHPGKVLEDVSGTLKEIANLDRLIREGTGTKGGRITFPGVRDVYVQTSLRRWLMEKTADIVNKALKKTERETKAKPDSAAFRKALERNMEEVYRANADALINTASTVAKGYSASEVTRQKFEDSYIANLGLATESIAKTTALNSKVFSEVTRDVANSNPVTKAAASYLQSSKSPVSSETVQRIIPRTATPIERTSLNREYRRLDDLEAREQELERQIERYERQASRARSATTTDAIRREIKRTKTQLQRIRVQITRSRDAITRIKEPTTPKTRPVSIETPRRGRTPETPSRETPPKEPPVASKGTGKKEKEWTKEEFTSAIKWKDGFVIHAVKSPYRHGVDEESFHINNIPKDWDLSDVLNYEGPGSQQASVKVTGKFPSKLTVDVGNQDVILTRQRGNKVRMQHNYGPRTVSHNTIKKRNRGRNISKKRGRIYVTKAGGSTMLSRRPLRGY